MNHQRIQILKQFVDQEPENPFNVYALAMEYYHNDPAQALDLLQNLLQKHPNYLPSYYKAAHLYWEIDDWEQAEQTFLKGISLAESQHDKKAQKELRSAYLNFKFEVD